MYGVQYSTNILMSTVSIYSVTSRALISNNILPHQNMKRGYRTSQVPCDCPSAVRSLPEQVGLSYTCTFVTHPEQADLN